ncbi:GNAT family N-acetyltransferase [Streptomyces sp. ACA25]|uniref:GNAT family N-acetyltransferase n=1 Tax=Streptomyces sp. ACA25 TaxID=3022596 RepID=UPI0023075034|nr:GNAT family N-acetyltransferase [Streptomyces sp. ACA25]MDB1087532.1 GNAT family N-acetyltransferase [Streptomyces sp. ACA25]
MDIDIRAARPEEWDEAGELSAQAYLQGGLLGPGAADSPYLAQLRDARPRAQHAELLVAAGPADGDLLGTVTFVAVPGSRYSEIAQPGEAEFRMLAVLPRARGRGIGEALVRECVRRAAALGRDRVALSVLDGNRSAHRLYERLGFGRVPERDWQPLPGLSLLVFTLPLPGPPSPSGSLRRS